MPQGPSLKALLRSLDLEREDDIPDLAWLERSYQDPAPFWALLEEHARLVASPAGKSRPGVAIDLYADAVARHADTDRIALRYFDRRARAFRDLSFTELDETASAVAAAWEAEGIAPGDPIAILLPLGPDYLIAFAAALRLGACASFLPPDYDRHLALRLAGAKPKRVVFNPRRKPPIEEKYETLFLDIELRGRAARVPPHSFAPDEPCAAILSPVRAPLGKPVLLSAEDALLNALRDAVIALRLSPGRTLAAPGLHPEQHFPSLLFAVLLAGATLVHVDIDDLAADPSLLAASPINVLAVPHALCEILRARPLPSIPGLEHWIRPVDEPLDWLSYRDFIQKNNLAQIPVSNFLADAASGGFVFFSTRRPGSPSARIMPSAGRPFALFDPASGELSTAGHGLFVPLPSKKPLADGVYVIARQGAEYLYGSTRVPRRAARVVPESEIAALLAELPFVAGSCIAPVPGSPGARFDFHLVVYTGARPGEDPDALREDRRAAVEKAIRERLGPDAQPDRIELFALFPVREGQKVDAAACRAQYLSGRLERKAREPALQMLAELRGATLGD